jgi:hypothetical protein
MFPGRKILGDLCENVVNSSYTQQFKVVNSGNMDVSDIEIDMVRDDYDNRREYLRLSWLTAVDSEEFHIALPCLVVPIAF